MIFDEIQPFLDHPEELASVRKFHEMEFRVEEDREARFRWYLEFQKKDGESRRFSYIHPAVRELDFLVIRSFLARAGLLGLIDEGHPPKAGPGEQ